jgi:hypothetical protein
VNRTARGKRRSVYASRVPRNVQQLHISGLFSHRRLCHRRNGIYASRACVLPVCCLCAACVLRVCCVCTCEPVARAHSRVAMCASAQRRIGDVLLVHVQRDVNTLFSPSLSRRLAAPALEAAIFRGLFTVEKTVPPSLFLNRLSSAILSNKEENSGSLSIRTGTSSFRRSLETPANNYV